MKTIYTKDASNRKMFITREFAAPLSEVWEAWTDYKLLDEWWAPKPFKATTKLQDFREGGSWLYCMVGPDGQEFWCRADYKSILPLSEFVILDTFCDSNGKATGNLPQMEWKCQFNNSEIGTKVDIEMSFASEADMQTIMAMGFEEGFTAAHGNLDAYLQAQFKLRKEWKGNSKSRVTTYLNFPGTAEEAFTFYKEVFGTQFNGKGIQRFGDIPAESGHPPVADKVKKMVLHVELPILGNHVLMATDSPREMGFSLTQGNNMHICLEPETKSETKRLFDALSGGGAVTMPLTDMFFGAYFGTCTDKYGINWMFNCIEKK